MDNQKLRELLEVYRPGIDDQDEQFAELITALRNDPSLQRQLDERVARDNALGAKLRSVRPPLDLKARLLREQKVVAVPVSFWRQPQWLTAAAALLILGLVVYGLSVNRSATFPAYRAEMAKFVADEYQMDTKADDLDVVREDFAAKHWPADYIVPEGLKKISLEGGCRREWHGKKVSLLCFDNKDAGDVWLFVVDRHVTADAPAGTEPQIAQAGKITTASWTRGEYTYILATEKPEVPISRYF